MVPEPFCFCFIGNNSKYYELNLRVGSSPVHHFKFVLIFQKSFSGIFSLIYSYFKTYVQFVLAVFMKEKSISKFSNSNRISELVYNGQHRIEISIESLRSATSYRSRDNYRRYLVLKIVIPGSYF